jgi:hypothetical protein
VGILQLIGGALVALLSIESVGLVSDAEFAVDWALAIPALLLLGTIGFTVAYASGHPRWLRPGALGSLAGLIAGVVASVAAGSVAAGVLPFVVVQFFPAGCSSRAPGSLDTQA